MSKGYFSDLWTVIKGDLIELDADEAKLFGAPAGETISLFAAMEARHGYTLACIACFCLSIIVEWGHCKNQLAGRDMSTMAYVRAGIGVTMLALAPLALIWFLWRFRIA